VTLPDPRVDAATKGQAPASSAGHRPPVADGCRSRHRDDDRRGLALRDAGRDLYTPAPDAISRLLPAEHRLADLHAGMVAADGSWLRTAKGRRIDGPVPMRATLARQRTASTVCNGPGDWPLLTVFDELTNNWS